MSESTISNQSESQQLLRACAAAQWRGGTGFDAASLDGSKPALIKRGDRRAIYRVDLSHGPVFIKHRTARWFSAWLDRLRGAASRREYLQALEAERRGVPTVQALAYATDAGEGASREQLLVTAALPGACQLDVFIEEHRLGLAVGTLRRRALVEALAKLCAAAHEAGLEHDDLHAGNILVVWPAAQLRPALHLIDLDKARFHHALSWRAARRNLAMLFCGLHHVANERDLRRFWHVYLKQRHGLRVDRREAAKQILTSGMRRVAQVLRDRDRRALRNNRQFTVVRTAAGVALGLAEDGNAKLAEWLAMAQQLIAQPGAEALKLSFGGLVLKSSLPGSPAEAIVLKRFRPKGWLKRLVAPFRPSRARINWVRGHALLARGIATATPRCVLEPWPAALGGESYLATEWIAGARNLHLYLWDLAKRPEEEQRAALRHDAESLGALLGKMHFYQVAHRDLKAGNLTAAESQGTTCWYLLDLDGVRLRRSIRFAERAANLARLAVSAEIHPLISRADRWRFLKAYAQAAGQRDDLRVLWRAVAKECRRHVERLESRGSIVA
ncbi:MAG: lipopolysaccharide kinase InaA family protein [Planctomycetia bacterium]|nr:lipopolysaccharide kinase InaA family protein [Planctomycetia bacterium]